MKCSIETLEAVRKLLVADFAQQLEAGEAVSASELEAALRSSLQAAGQVVRPGSGAGPTCPSAKARPARGKWGKMRP